MTQPPPANPRIRAAVDSLSEAEREHFEERAGIHEHCNGMDIEDAEALALRQVKAGNPTS